MKILKILPIGVMAFLAISEGRAADKNDCDQERGIEGRLTTSQSSQSHEAMHDLTQSILWPLSETFKECATRFPDISQRLCATPGFSSAETKVKFQRIENLLQEIGNATTEINGIVEGFWAIQSHLNAIAYTGSGIPPTLAEEKEPEIIKRELSEADFVKIFNETKDFRQETIEFTMPFNPHLNLLKEGVEGTIDVKDTFDFLEMNGHLRVFEGLLANVSQASPSLETIFYELDSNNSSQAYKKGLFGLVKVIEDFSHSLFFKTLHTNQHTALLETAQKITDYIEEHKA